MSDVFRAHRLAREVHPFDQRIGRDDAPVAARRLPHRCIIANADQHAPIGNVTQTLANARD
jgi:hypothetical protein